MGKVLKLWERLYRIEKVGKVSKFQERLFNDNFKAGNGEERKGKGKLSVPPQKVNQSFLVVCALEIFLLSKNTYSRLWSKTFSSLYSIRSRGRN